MVTYIRSDLDFILDQIKVSEAHAAGQPLYGPGGLVPSYNVSTGLRTVDGTLNNLLPGQESWGAAHVPFVEFIEPSFRPAEVTTVDFDGPGPAPGITTESSCDPSDDPNMIVFDPALRTIFNLIVDQTLANPAAVMKGLELGGVAEATMANVGLVQGLYDIYSPTIQTAFLASGVLAPVRNA